MWIMFKIFQNQGKFEEPHHWEESQAHCKTKSTLWKIFPYLDKSVEPHWSQLSKHQNQLRVQDDNRFVAPSSQQLESKDVRHSIIGMMMNDGNNWNDHEDAKGVGMLGVLDKCSPHWDNFILLPFWGFLSTITIVYIGLQSATYVLEFEY